MAEWTEYDENGYLCNKGSFYNPTFDCTVDYNTIGIGRWELSFSTQHLHYSGVVYVDKDTSLCCEKCHYTYSDTFHKLYDIKSRFSYTSRIYREVYGQESQFILDSFKSSLIKQKIIVCQI